METNRFEYSIETEPSDFRLELCVTSGQVFRWNRIDERHWSGVEGVNWYSVDVSDDKCLRIVSNAPQESFCSLFRLDWDGTSIRNEIVARGPELQPYIDQLPGLRVMRPSSSTETFFCFMCTPNNHLNRITSMIRSLSEFGIPFESNPVLRQFPSIEVIADIEERTLREKGFGYRAATITQAARQLLDLGGDGYLGSLKKLSYREAHTALVSIHGIGPKLADCIALFALDHSESVPIDTHIWQAATRVYFPDWQGTALTASKYAAVGDFMRGRFGELAGWTHQYLFFENLLNWRSRK